MGLYFDMIAAKTGITHVLGKDHFSLSLSDLILGRCFFLSIWFTVSQLSNTPAMWYWVDVFYQFDLFQKWKSFFENTRVHELWCFTPEDLIEGVRTSRKVCQRTSSRVLALHEKYAGVKCCWSYPRGFSNMKSIFINLYFTFVK